MTHAEAKQLCERLAREHPDRETHQWIASQGDDGEWSVVKFSLPEALRRDPLKATIEAKPKPPQADDPRPAYWRDVGGPYVG